MSLRAAKSAVCLLAVNSFFSPEQQQAEAFGFGVRPTANFEAAASRSTVHGAGAARGMTMYSAFKKKGGKKKGKAAGGGKKPAGGGGRGGGGGGRSPDVDTSRKVCCCASLGGGHDQALTRGKAAYSAFI